MKIILGLALFAIAGLSAPALAQTPPADDAQVCSVLHALPFKNDPQRVNGTYDSDVDTLTSFVAGHIYAMWADTAATRLHLSDADLKVLNARTATYSFRGFEPKCGWTVHEEDPAKGVLRFARPIFSDDGKLVLVAFSRFSDATTGVGYLCSIRQEGRPLEAGGWVPRCTFTWLS